MKISACWLIVGLTLISGAPAAAEVAAIPFITDAARPMRLVAPPGDPRLFVLQQNGLVRAYDPDGQPRGIFLDVVDSTLTGFEQGLLGMAFAPDYATSGRFYINLIAPDGDTRIVRLRVRADDPDVADPASWETILVVDQPFANHNGGHLEFGPDGMLYVGLGDGGGPDDPENRAQDTTTLLGKMLRLDVATPTGYAIPPDNPLVGGPGRGEIWALGLRNPWSYAFDDLTGDLYLADVGQQFWEEIDLQPAGSRGGENYGWDILEGAHCHEPPDGCDATGLVLPIFEYAHDAVPPRCSISGGQVYRGAALPHLAGRYFFADWCSGEVWSIRSDGQGGVSEVVDWTPQLAPPGGFRGVVAISRDARGELYLVDRGANVVYKIVDDASTAAPSSPMVAVSLAPNAPNPFNPSTEIAFSLSHDGTTVALRIYDLAGRLVRTLVDGTLDAGRHTARWDGADARGRPAPSGVYRYRLEVSGEVHQRTMVLLK